MMRGEYSSVSLSHKNPTRRSFRSRPAVSMFLVSRSVGDCHVENTITAVDTATDVSVESLGWLKLHPSLREIPLKKSILSPELPWARVLQTVHRFMSY